MKIERKDNFDINILAGICRIQGTFNNEDNKLIGRIAIDGSSVNEWSNCLRLDSLENVRVLIQGLNEFVSYIENNQPLLEASGENELKGTKVFHWPCSQCGYKQDFDQELCRECGEILE